MVGSGVGVGVDSLLVDFVSSFLLFFVSTVLFVEAELSDDDSDDTFFAVWDCSGLQPDKRNEEDIRIVAKKSVTDLRDLMMFHSFQF